MGYKWKKTGHELTIIGAGDGYIVAHYTILYTFEYVENVS